MCRCIRDRNNANGAPSTVLQRRLPGGLNTRTVLACFRLGRAKLVSDLLSGRPIFEVFRPSEHQQGQKQVPL